MTMNLMTIGFLVMGASVLIGLISIVFFKLSKKKLNEKLQAEFGNPKQFMTK